jgi:hypothetical protein
MAQDSTDEKDVYTANIEAAAELDDLLVHVNGTRRESDPPWSRLELLLLMIRDALPAEIVVEDARSDDDGEEWKG